jgi:predicted transcriptional regulator
MKRTTIFIDEGTERELQALARKQRRPMASIVREAVEKYVLEQRRSPERPQLTFIAAGRSGHTDTADRHETLLFDEAAPPLRPVGRKSTPPVPRQRKRARARKPSPRGNR